MMALVSSIEPDARHGSQKGLSKRFVHLGTFELLACAATTTTTSNDFLIQLGMVVYGYGLHHLRVLDLLWLHGKTRKEGRREGR